MDIIGIIWNWLESTLGFGGATALVYALPIVLLTLAYMSACNLCKGGEGV